MSSFILIRFSFFLSDSLISTILSSTSLILSSASLILLFVPSRVFFYLIYCIILEREMATHSSVLAWRIPGMEEPSGLPSMGSHRVGHD